MIVSVFENIKQTECKNKTSVDAVLELIRTGGKKKDEILDLREVYKIDKA